MGALPLFANRTYTKAHTPYVRATVDGGAGLAGDPKLNIFTEQLLQIAHLAGDPKRKG